MINIAIFNLKDLFKYFLKLLVIVMLIYCISKSYKFIGQTSSTKYLNRTIPAISYLNTDSEIAGEFSIEKVSKISFVEHILNSQLKMKNNILPKKDENTNEQKKEEAIVENKDTAENFDTTVKTGVGTEVVRENNLAETYTNQYNSVEIKNSSKYALTEEILTPNINLQNKNDIIIFHTHTTESYTPSDTFNYTMTGLYRSTDLNYSVARVGDELESQLKNYGFNVFHDKTVNDYPAYTGSYNRSLEAVTKDLESMKNTEIIFDLHRDAVGSENTYAPTVKIGDEYAAQIMFVIGTDGGGLFHPNWQQNLKFAVKVQEKANELYPGLFKPIVLRNSRYNQHLVNYATLIEVGATGNTLEQCLVSAKYLAYILNETIKGEE